MSCYQRKEGCRQATTKNEGLILVKNKRIRLYARGAGQRYRCSIAFGCAVADLMVLSRARARPRPHPRDRLAHVPVAAQAAAAACTCRVAAEGACKTAATVLQAEQEPGSIEQA